LALAFSVSSAVGTSASDSHSTLDPETYKLLADTRKDEDRAIGGEGAPTLPEQINCRANNGERRGLYHDLEMVVAVVLDPSDALLTLVVKGVSSFGATGQSLEWRKAAAATQ